MAWTRFWDMASGGHHKEKPQRSILKHLEVMRSVSLKRCSDMTRSMLLVTAVVKIIP